MTRLEPVQQNLLGFIYLGEYQIVPRQFEEGVVVTEGKDALRRREVELVLTCYNSGVVTCVMR